ncbi:MAG: PIN domain-containing protein [Acidimicrobiales bacterium]
MVFVEGFRLLLVLAGAIAGLQIGHRVGQPPSVQTDQVIGMVLGALIAYVIGGILGRLLDRGMQDAVAGLRRMPPAEIFAASVLGTTGLLAGLVAGLPLIAFVHSSIDYPVVAALAWALGAFGVRLGVVKGRQIVRAAGLSRILDPPADTPPGAVVVDASAVMDRFLAVLGRAGLLAGGVVVPRFVIDEVRSIAKSPDPVASRRARRGLESLEALRSSGLEVQFTADEAPAGESGGSQALVLAQRMGLRLVTCSAELASQARSRGGDVLDLKALSAQLTPDHPPGERLLVDLVKLGSQAGQAVGYLPEGDMVVVNDAAHLVGRSAIEVSVMSTRQTAQGTIVFARLTGGPSAATTAISGGDDRGDQLGQ